MKKITLTLRIKLSTSFDDNYEDNNEETVKYLVEQDLEDLGYNVEEIEIESN